MTVRQADGFTLLEVLLTLVLLSLLSSVVVLAVRDMEGTLDDAKSRLRTADAEARFDARKTPQEIRFDLDAGRVRRLSRTHQQVVETVRLPRGVGLDRGWILRSGEVQEVTHGEMVVPVSSEGRSSCYGLTLVASEGSASLTVAGLTGEWIDGEIEDVQKLLSGDDPR